MGADTLSQPLTWCLVQDEGPARFRYLAARAPPVRALSRLMSLRFAYLAVLRTFSWLVLLASSDRAKERGGSRPGRSALPEPSSAATRCAQQTPAGAETVGQMLGFREASPDEPRARAARMEEGRHRAENARRMPYSSRPLNVVRKACRYCRRDSPR